MQKAKFHLVNFFLVHPLFKIPDFLNSMYHANIPKFTDKHNKKIKANVIAYAKYYLGYFRRSLQKENREILWQ